MKKWTALLLALWMMLSLTACGDVSADDVIAGVEAATQIVEMLEGSDTTVEIGEDELLVMGDNRLDSKDSRSAAVGCIERKNILGRGTAVLWPIKEFTILD